MVEDARDVALMLVLLEIWATNIAKIEVTLSCIQHAPISFCSFIFDR